MIRSYFPFIFIFCVFLPLSLALTSCEQVPENTTALPAMAQTMPTDGEIDQLVQTVSEQYGLAQRTDLSPFAATGRLETFTGFDTEQKQDFIRIALTEETKDGSLRTALFEVHLDEAIDFPALIENGKVVYLQNQLTVIDLTATTSLHFYVTDGVNDNLLPMVKTINSSSLLLARGKEALNGDLKSGGCSCSCKRCWNSGDCGSSSSSCGCGGNSQSITCRSGFNASCTQCDDPRE